MNQDLPPTEERNEFLINYKNKLQIVNLLVDSMAWICSPSRTGFSAQEADQQIPMHSVYVFQENNCTICVIVDDTNI